MTSTLRAYRPPPPLPINDLQEVTSKGQSKESGQLMLPKYLQVGDDFKGKSNVPSDMCCTLFVCYSYSF